jgi:hypothetical protein
VLLIVGVSGFFTIYVLSLNYAVTYHANYFELKGRFISALFNRALNSLHLLLLLFFNFVYSLLLTQRDLGIRNLPIRMCDPDIKPVMCKQVQAACETFPAIVSRVVDFYGLTTDEFTTLYDKSNSDTFFRMKVRREINKIEKERTRAKRDSD